VLLGIRLQEYSAKQGITDIEIEASDLKIIVEAKRGWTLPATEQLRLYAARHPDIILVLSECSEEYVRQRLINQIDGVPVLHRSWKDIARLVRSSMKTSRNQERRILSEFLSYMGTAMPIQDQETNLVFVVALGGGSPPDSNISWIDIVEKNACYFHPVGDGWPKVPPNYVGFRYAGRLKAIRHIEEYSVGVDPHLFVPEMNSRKWNEHYFYRLGPAIIPPQEIRTGRIYPSGRVWAALDLLLTSGTISEARDKTDERRTRLTR
jgi:hypothetical protein